MLGRAWLKKHKNSKEPNGCAPVEMFISILLCIASQLSVGKHGVLSPTLTRAIG